MDQLEFKLLGFHERFAIIHNTKVGEIQWPIKNLPDEIEKGETFLLKIETLAASLGEQDTDKDVKKDPFVVENSKEKDLKKVLEDLIN